MSSSAHDSTHRSTVPTDKKKHDPPLDKKAPGAVFLLPALTFMVVLVLGVAVFALFRAW
ncbi:hypothetical protein CA51_24140 [Rosistilla oblonga]|uniref:Uncharacterized protein n=1 Tax=Rosistilla oblonga TaxID=2527990 RepID=A0A518J1Z2_9BACT|nr:hypothetical protein [Rosistilla oblonga]QDV12529.1 hypothetical protein CA51_24140 [Rosistilla oblonga]QDV59355.1 hypothetical protein Mal33_53830 [Rosistilla oblonga]